MLESFIMSILFILSEKSTPMNDELSKKVIGAAFKVHNQLGFGFLESVYEKALSIELSKLSIPHELQSPIQVLYDDHIVGDFISDMLVDGALILEFKSVRQLTTAHDVQLVNYLNATQMDVGLLINFGPTKVEVKRKYRRARE